MWEPADEGGGDGELRQGDLLSEFVLPILTFPVEFVHAPGTPVTEGDSAVLRSKRSHYLVVSHCCTIAQHGFVALAPIRKTATQSDNAAAYTAENLEATDDFVVAVHPLDPLPGVLDPLEMNRLWCADFLRIQTYRDAQNLLSVTRVGRMTPPGRRLLRMRLMAFWGRVEAADLQWFEENNLPPSFAAEGHL